MKNLDKVRSFEFWWKSRPRKDWKKLGEMSLQLRRIILIIVKKKKKLEIEYITVFEER